MDISNSGRFSLIWSVKVVLLYADLPCDDLLEYTLFRPQNYSQILKSNI